MKTERDVVDKYIGEIIGKDSVELIILLKGKENVSEFKLAEKLKITVNQVRNMLYRLYSHNLVSFTRKKDKKKGWYIYYWTFDLSKTKELIINLINEKIRQLNNLLTKEKQEDYFVCPAFCVRMKIETALEHDFKCSECGKILEQEDNIKIIRGVERQIKELEEDLSNAIKIEIIKKVERQKKKKVRKKVKKKIKKKMLKKKARRKKSVSKYSIEKRISRVKKKKSRKRYKKRS